MVSGGLWWIREQCHVWIYEYGAPEFFSGTAEEQSYSGRAVDVFSMGAIMLDLLTVMCHVGFTDFRKKRYKRGLWINCYTSQPDRSFHAHKDVVEEWAHKLSEQHPLRKELVDVILPMLDHDETKRPTPEDISSRLMSIHREWFPKTTLHCMPSYSSKKNTGSGASGERNHGSSETNDDVDDDDQYVGQYPEIDMNFEEVTKGG